MVLTSFGAEVVHALEQPLRILVYAILKRRSAPRAMDRAFGRRAVVAGQIDHERVIAHTKFIDGIENSPDLSIGVRHECCEHFHQP